MAQQALSTLGIKFGWGIGTMKKAPTVFKQIEGCISIGGVEVSKDKLDCTPLEAKRKQYTGGYEDTGGELSTVFNDTDEFDEKWAEVLTAFDGMTSDKVMYFCAYHPKKAKMNVYIVEPASLPAPEYSTGNVLQYTINNVLVDFPDPITAIEPTLDAVVSGT